MVSALALLIQVNRHTPSIRNRLGKTADELKRCWKILSRLETELRELDAKCAFIKAILEGKLKINNRKRAEIELDLDDLDFSREDGSYDHLLRMPIHSLTREKYDELQEQAKKKQKERNKVAATEPVDMYVQDLNDLLKKVK